MKGIQHVIASNRTAKFEFDLYRNITIVRGNSGTGKTTLYNMIADYTRLGAKSGAGIFTITDKHMDKFTPSCLIITIPVTVTN